MKKVRWGVIGAGGIADRRTIPGMMLAENAELVAETAEESIKNSLYVSTLSISGEGKYYLGGSTGSCYVYGIEVTTKKLEKGPRVDWSTVNAPTFASISANEDGTIGVTTNALVDHNGADYLLVNMYQDGKEISTVKSTFRK